MDSLETKYSGLTAALSTPALAPPPSVYHVVRHTNYTFGTGSSSWVSEMLASCYGILTLFYSSNRRSRREWRTDYVNHMVYRKSLYDLDTSEDLDRRRIDL